MIAAALQEANVQEANVRFSWASIRLMKRCILTKAPGLLRGQDVLASCRCCMAAPKSPLSSIMSLYFLQWHGHIPHMHMLLLVYDRPSIVNQYFACHAWSGQRYTNDLTSGNNTIKGKLYLFKASRPA